jgi:DNA-binding transcriptional regulator YiaG
MNRLQIEELLRAKPFRHNMHYVEHPFKSIFSQRNITQPSLAKLLGVSKQIVHNWFQGRVPIPPRRLAQLEEIKNEVLAWEAKNKKLFGT